MRASKTEGHWVTYKDVEYHLQVGPLKRARNRQGTGQPPLHTPTHTALSSTEVWEAQNEKQPIS